MDVIEMILVIPFVTNIMIPNSGAATNPPGADLDAKRPKGCRQGKAAVKFLFRFSVCGLRKYVLLQQCSWKILT